MADQDSNPRLAWHYTIGLRASQILAEGVIRPATEKVPAGERPCVWFSVRQHWEPTANKALADDEGNVRVLTFAETVEYGHGAWRFGRPVSALQHWRKLRVAVGMSSESAKALAAVGRDHGSGPEFWYGVVGSVPVSECVVQRLVDGEWRPAQAEG